MRTIDGKIVHVTLYHSPEYNTVHADVRIRDTGFSLYWSTTRNLPDDCSKEAFEKAASDVVGEAYYWLTLHADKEDNSDLN